MDTKEFFLTWPRCADPKEEIMNGIRLLPDLEWAFLAQELHQDGTPHIHALLGFTKRKSVKNPDYFDFLTPSRSHANIQKMRSRLDSIAYLKKSDPSPLIFGQLPETESGERTKKTDEIAKRLMEGAEISSIVEDHPGFTMMHLPRMISFKTFWTNSKDQAKKNTNRSTTIRGIGVIADAMTDQLDELSDRSAVMDFQQKIHDLEIWLNRNLFEPRTFRQLQLFIQSPPGVGKSSLINFIEEHFAVYRPAEEAFFDGYDDKFDLAVFDEFAAKHTRTSLCQFMDGGACRLRIKGGTIEKKKNMPVIFLSNYTPEHLYNDKIDYDAFTSRIFTLRFRGDCKIGPPLWAWIHREPEPDSTAPSEEPQGSQPVTTSSPVPPPFNFIDLTESSDEETHL